jgi:hypothetical protein
MFGRRSCNSPKVANLAAAGRRKYVSAFNTSYDGFLVAAPRSVSTPPSIKISERLLTRDLSSKSLSKEQQANAAAARYERKGATIELTGRWKGFLRQMTKAFSPSRGKRFKTEGRKK